MGTLEAKTEEKRDEIIMKEHKTHFVVGTLLVTVTFAVSFTLPAGFESDSKSPNKGATILIRNAAF